MYDFESFVLDNWIQLITGNRADYELGSFC